ncbi:hypothetical protein [Falsiroseomonas sp. E2-1-a4]
MTYHFTTSLEGPMERAVKATTEALQRHGFGILTALQRHPSGARRRPR